MDVIGSEPRPPSRWEQRVGAALQRLSGHRRVATVLVVVVAVAGALVLATTKVGLDRSDEYFATGPVEAAPAARPPFDNLPGRMPIPAPMIVGYDKQTVTGRLPALGAPGYAAAEAAARLVLGRYCQTPAAYAVVVRPEREWMQVRALIYHMDGGDPPAMRLRLVWESPAYSWTGKLPQLAGC
jgi:hypothetical protein